MCPARVARILNQQACPAANLRMIERPCRSRGLGKPKRHSQQHAPAITPIKKIVATTNMISLGRACTKGQAGHTTAGHSKAGHWQGSHSSEGQAKCAGAGADQNVFSVETSEATTPAIKADCDMSGAISFTKKA